MLAKDHPFASNDMMSLTDQVFNLDLAESIGPDLRLSALLGPLAGPSDEDVSLAYGTARGSMALRERIAERHGVGVDEVVVTVGGMHGIFLLSMILANRGSEVVTLVLSFPNAHKAVGYFGARVVEVKTSFDEGYQLDPTAVCGQLSPRTTLVTLASPQSPSGVAIGREAIRVLAERMSIVRPQAFLLVDETYREATCGDKETAPTSLDLHPRIVSCASLSKCHGAPGLRIGWVITHDAGLRDQLERGKFASVIACSAVDEMLAVRLLAQSASVLGERRRRFDAGLSLVQAWVGRYDPFIEWVRPDAGALCCVRLRPDVFGLSAVERFHRILAASGTRVSPGSWFGDSPQVFRLGFGLPGAHELENELGLLTGALVEAAGKPIGVERS